MTKQDKAFNRLQGRYDNMEQYPVIKKQLRCKYCNCLFIINVTELELVNSIVPEFCSVFCADDYELKDSE